MAKNLKITLANDDVLHVTRNWWDTFVEGFTNTIVHQGEKRISINNRYIIKTESDNDNTGNK